MPIEFRCTACHKLLQTPDNTAGKQAKCPECGTLMQIPSPAAPTPPPPGESPFGQSSSPPSGFPAGQPNPYQSPVDYVAPAPPPPGSFTPSKIEFSDIFGRTFRIFGQQWSMCLLGFLAATGVSLAFVLCVGGFAFGLGAIAQNEAITVVLIIVVVAALALFSNWLGIGMLIFFLKLARGEQPEFGDLFRGGPFFITTLLAGLLFAMACLGGLLLFIVPGIILGLMFSQFRYLIVDRNLAVVESLTTSKQITEGNKLTLFAVLFVANLVGQLAMQACSLLVFVVVPFLSLLGAVIYLVMTGQATADQYYPSYPGAPGRWAPTASGSPFAPPAPEKEAPETS